MGFTVADMPEVEREVAEDAPRMMRGSTTCANCVECPFSKFGKPDQPVLGEGWNRPNWIIVGESPGHNERQQQRPFVGMTGRMVNEVIAKIGVARDSLWLTNATLCIPPQGATDNDKKLARKACAPRLQHELQQFPGKPILALGAIASQGFCGDKFSITQMAGAYYEVDINEFPWKPRDPQVFAQVTGAPLTVHDDTAADIHEVIVTIHPAAILRGGSSSGGGGSHTVDLAFWNLLYDAQKAHMLAQKRDIKFSLDVQIEAHDAVRAEKLIREFVQEIRKGPKRFTCDTETYVDDPKQGSALSPINAKLSAIGLATPDHAISVSWNILTPYAKRLIGALFADSSITKIFHNRIYDEAVLTKQGYTFNGPIECTMLGHHNAFPGLAHNLQRVTTQFYATHPWKSEFRHGHGSTEELLVYCGLDTLSTARIEAPIQINIKRSQAERTYEVDLIMAKVAAKMHLDGVPISREVNTKLRDDFRTNIAKARQALFERIADAGIIEGFKTRLAFEQARRTRKHDSLDLDVRIDQRLAEINAKPFNFMIDSGDHIVAFLKSCGVPLSITTASGRISTKKDVLEAFVSHPEVSALLNYRENSKLLSTFVERLFDRTYDNGKTIYGFADENDRVHPRWSVHAITSRWRNEAPQTMNWPKADPKKGRPNLRTQVVAPPGRNLVAFDAKQIEARVVALISGDPFLLDIFTSGKDIHTEFARIVWPEWDSVPKDEQKVRRDIVKRPEYCLVPGTRVLAKDLTWRKIETLKPGDKLIGFTSSEPGKSFKENYFKESIVKHVKTLKQPCYHVVTDQGEFTASDEHLWIGRPQWQPKKGHRVPVDRARHWQTKRWLRTDQLQVNDLLMFTTQPWEQLPKTYELGFLEGLYEGEGWIGKNAVGFGQNPGQTFTRAENIIKQFGFQWTRTKSNDCLHGEIKGGLWENLRFMAQIQPPRLMPKIERIWEDRRLRGKGVGARVLSIKYVGTKTVVAVETTTNTFIAEGFLSHNCSFYAGSIETAWRAVVRDYPAVTIGMIERMVRMMEVKMPGIAAWHNEVMRRADRDGEIRSIILGRRRAFPTKQFDKPEAINYGVQTTGREIISLGIVDIMPRLPITTFPILDCHDALVFECDEDDTDLVKQLVITSFTRDVTHNGITMNFPVDAKAGKTWAIVN